MVGKLPSTFYPAGHSDRPKVFDPALKQYQSAFRAGDPPFDRPEDAALWRDVRRRATDHVLRAIAESPWADSLVLRGSRLLRAWLGEAAREPGDLDWVFRPATGRPTDRSAAALLAGLATVVAHRPGLPGFEFLHDKVATDAIWTYERAEGRRVVYPWRVPGLPAGEVQVDFVFQEGLDEPPARTPVPTAEGDCVTVWAAGPGQSLAWKLLWLETDSYPQGKDLYDAALLAENVYLPRPLLQRTLGATRLPATSGEFVVRWAVDWDNFVEECPWVEGDVKRWCGRLAAALAPTFAACDQPARSLPLRPRWATPTVLGLARAIAAERAFDALPVLADALEEGGCEDPDVLAHCRAGLPHAWDCWVVGMLLAGG